MPHPPPIPPQPGQESVWDYPRPPRVEPTSARIQVVFNGELIADTQKAWRVLETSHPPVYYLPQADLAMECFLSTGRGSFCEFKGQASYWTVKVGNRQSVDAGWSYPNPSRGFEGIRDHIALYAGRMDHCTVDGERVQPQPGDFYGGWITASIVGPFKGIPGSWGW